MFCFSCEIGWECGPEVNSNPECVACDILLLLVESFDVLSLQDRNQGLVRQCVVAMYKKNIKRLTKVT